MVPGFIARASALAFATATLSSRSFVPTAMRSTSSNTPVAATAAANQFVLRYNYIPDVLEKRGPHREQHLALAKELCLLGGPTAAVAATTVPTGALFVFADLQAAQAFVEQDPYVSAGIVTEHSIEEWTMAIRN